MDLTLESSEAAHVIPYLIKRQKLDGDEVASILGQCRQKLATRTKTPNLHLIIDALYDVMPLEVEQLVNQLFDQLPMA